MAWSQSTAISVIIPLYNCAQYIERALSSVIAQSFEDFEVLIINDGSTDGSETVAASIDDSRIRIISQENSGVSAARNRGLAEMSGDIAAFLDADDEWLPSHLENIFRVAEIFPEAGIVGTGYRLLRSGGYAAEITIDSPKPRVLQDYFAMANKCSILTMSSCAVRKWAVEKLGGLVVGEKLGEDVEFEARIALNFPVAFHPEVTAIYHNDVPTSAMANSAISWSAKEPLIVQRFRDLQGKPELDTDIFHSFERYSANILYGHAISGIITKNFAEADAILRDPLVNHSDARPLVQLLKPALKCMPKSAVGIAVRLLCSRWFQPKMSVRNGVSYKVLSRISKHGGTKRCNR